MTPERLAEIRAKVDALPPPPWTWEDWSQDFGPRRNTLQYIRLFKDDWERQVWGQRSSGRPIAIVGCSDCGSDCEPAVREFLAEARVEVVELCDEVASLTAERDELRAILLCLFEPHGLPFNAGGMDLWERAKVVLGEDGRQ